MADALSAISRGNAGRLGPLGRFRQQVRFSHPLGSRRRLSIVVSDEVLVHINNTSRAARGIDQNRAFGGLSVATSAATRLDVGYLNQFSPGHRGASNTLNHALSCSFGLVF